MPFLKTPAVIARALIERDYKEATPVQKAVLQPEADGRDLLVSAQTGSGKTVAYGIAIAETLLAGAETMGPAGEPLALVIAPTRELAMQVQRELSWLYQYAGARVVACVGGMDPGRERRQLNDGVHIVVGTPGRLRDHMERGALKVSGLKVVVLDEADEMLDLGFREELQFILEATPQTRRTLLFSATLPKAIISMARHYQRDAFRIQTVSDVSGHADIEYRAIRIGYNDVENAVVNLLRFMDPPSTLVFCNTRQSVRHLEAMLLERGFAAVALSGELSQSERNHALQALRDGRARVCVATDVAARGIDLPNLGLVIHADLPDDPDVVLHRSGRTGRAGRKGVAILLVPGPRRRRAEELLGKARVTYVWAELPTAADIRKLDHDRLIANPILIEPGTEDDIAMADALIAARGPREIALAFVKMYRAQLPAPEEMSAVGDDRYEARKSRGDSGPREHKSRDHSPRERHEKDRPARPAKHGHDKIAAPHGELADGVWFRINLGRKRNADPKWLIPEICRRGDVTKQDIGKIRIYETETLFEIEAAKAGNFAALVTSQKKGGVSIRPAPDGLPADDVNASPPPGAAREHFRPDTKPPHAPKPYGDKPYVPKPYAGKPHGTGKPYGAKPYNAAKPHSAGKPKGKPYPPHDKGEARPKRRP